ncbi:MAG: nucleotide sugar dehydrogenase, partial [Flavobacteriales bacterium]|nr:nucleotide sugar dehydrogenase [Flavobacteriales bacterium]
VIYESTVYPGCTEDDCVPILEEVSGLKMGRDFKVGYSPERINPGDKKHNIRTITKVVSASDPDALEEVAKVYALVVDAGIHKAPAIKVAEASKVIENTQRDVNIALINELSIIMNKMGINTYDVLESAKTKWNFLPFTPGLVGGHCIGVDPYYLVYKAKKIGYHSKVISSARHVNDSMGFYVGKQTVKKILESGRNALESTVLVMGATFKENVSDIRNSKIVDVIRELESFSVKVEVVDPHAESDELKHEYGFELEKTPRKNHYDAIIIGVSHKEYKNLDEKFFKSLLKDGKGALIDVKGQYKGKIKELHYWSL